jgi:hypothetical protein
MSKDEIINIINNFEKVLIITMKFIENNYLIIKN